MPDHWDRFRDYIFMWRRPYADYRIETPVTHPDYQSDILRRTDRLVGETSKDPDEQASRLADVYVTEPRGWADLLDRARENPMAYKIMKGVCGRLERVLFMRVQSPLSMLPEPFLHRVHGKAVLYARWRGEEDPERATALDQLEKGLSELRTWVYLRWRDEIEPPKLSYRPPHAYVLRNAIWVRAVHDIAKRVRMERLPDPERTACSIVAEHVGCSADTVGKIWRQGGRKIVKYQCEVQARLDELGID